MEEFLQGAGGTISGAWQIITNPGVWIVLLISAAVWFLIKDKGYKWPGAIATVVFGLLIVFWVVPLITRNGLRSVGDTNRAYAKDCAYAGLPCPGDSPMYSLDTSTFSLETGGGGATYNSNPNGSGQGVVAEPQVTFNIRKDALAKWVAEKLPNLRPTDWLAEGASSDLLPKGTTCRVTMQENGAKTNEVWTWACNNSRGEYASVDGYVFETNGWIARDSRIFDVNDTGPDGVEVYGTGDWKDCTSCWDKEVVAPPSSVADSGSTETERTQSNDDGEANQTSTSTLKVVDNSGGGAWTYTPTGSGGQLSCVGVSQDHVGTIPFGTTVTSIQLFPGAGWTNYMGSKDLLLVNWNGNSVCVFAGTVQ